jgi:hypothetical protein
MRSQAASRRQSVVRSRRQSVQDPHKYPQQDYQALDDNVGRRGLLDPDDPFSDPFGDDETPAQEKPRMECECHLAVDASEQTDIVQGARSKLIQLATRIASGS